MKECRGLNWILIKEMARIGETDYGTCACPSAVLSDNVKKGF